jgi:hypothetical protein
MMVIHIFGPAPGDLRHAIVAARLEDSSPPIMLDANDMDARNAVHNLAPPFGARTLRRWWRFMALFRCGACKLARLAVKSTSGSREARIANDLGILRIASKPNTG